jgi:Big-like domain-containing protein
VAFYRDAGVLLGTTSASPYAITWDSSSAGAGAHTLYAVATDNAGNSGTSPLDHITVSVPTPPVLSVTSPTNGAIVARKSKLTIKASATPTANPISRVDFVVDSSVVCSDTTSPYSCNWTVPAKANTSYQIHANAYDTTGQVGVSSYVTVTAK